MPPSAVGRSVMRPSPLPKPSAPSAAPRSVDRPRRVEIGQLDVGAVAALHRADAERHVGAEMRVGDFLDAVAAGNDGLQRRRDRAASPRPAPARRLDRGLALAAQPPVAAALWRGRAAPSCGRRRFGAAHELGKLRRHQRQRRRRATPSASATALAMQTGVDMQLPSPTPFGAERRERRRRLHVEDDGLRHLRRGRQQIVGEGAGQKAAVLGVGIFLVERGAERLREAAADLPVDHAGMQDACRNRAS